MKRSINELAEISESKLDEKNVEALAKTLWFELQRQKKFSSLDLLMSKIRAIQASRNNQIQVEVSSYSGLSEEQQNEIIAKIEAKQKTKVLARFMIDKELMGGIKIKIGDDILDLSWKGKLEKIKQRTGR